MACLCSERRGVDARIGTGSGVWSIQGYMMCEVSPRRCCLLSIDAAITACTETLMGTIPRRTWRAGGRLTVMVSPQALMTREFYCSECRSRCSIQDQSSICVLLAWCILVPSLVGACRWRWEGWEESDDGINVTNCWKVRTPNVM